MSDLTEIQSSQSIKIAGAGPASGIEDNWADVDANGNLQVVDYSDGPVTPGTVAARSSLAGGQFNTTLPTLTTAQQSSLQLDSRGRLIVVTGTLLVEDHNYGVVGANTLRTASQIGNATGAADFNAGVTGAQTLRASVNITRNGTELSYNAGASDANTLRAAVNLKREGNDLDYNFGAASANSLRIAALIGNATGAADFNTGAAGAQTLRVTVANLPVTVDTNYGTVGANTLRTASQIGNATGAANFGAGATGAQTLRVEANQGATGSTAWLTTDAADGPVTPGVVASKSILAGGQFNTTLPTLANTQQASLQVDSSGRLITVGPQDVAATQNIIALDTGTSSLVGANGQVFYFGSPTANSAAVFALASVETVTIQANLLAVTGTLVVEVSMDGGTFWLRPNVYQISTQNYTNGFTAPFVAVVDTAGLTHLRVRSTSSWTGTATILVKETLNERMITIGDALPSGSNIIGGIFGNIASGAADSGNPVKVGGVFNTVLPVFTNSQRADLQVDSSGRLITVLAAGPQDILPATQNITARDIASTTTAVANGQSTFTGSPTAGSVAAFAIATEETIVVQASGTWTGTLQIEISMDGGTTWGIRPIHQVGNSTSPTAGSFTANFTGGCNVAGYTNFRVRSTAVMTGTATIKIVESLNANSVYVANAIKLTDANNDIAMITPNGDIQTADIINIAGQYRAQSVTTSAAEALGAASILTSRKMLTITPTNGTVYWGFNSSVTTSNGTPIFKNQTQSFAVGANVHIFVIAGSTTDCRITEGS